MTLTPDSLALGDELRVLPLGADFVLSVEEELGDADEELDTQNDRQVVHRHFHYTTKTSHVCRAVARFCAKTDHQCRRCRAARRPW